MLKMEKDKSQGKMEVMQICRELMPNGKPDYLSVVNYPMIKTLIAEKGQPLMHKVLILLVKDFCNSLNVVRNMNEEQMIEAAGMLLDECDNFRLEDYTMMFQLAKRGELKDIHDRIDLQVITDILDAYWKRRHDASEQVLEKEIKHLETMGSQTRSIEYMHKKDGELMELSEGFASALGGLKDLVNEKVGDKKERERLAQIEKEDSEKIKQQLKKRGYAENNENE